MSNTNRVNDGGPAFPCHTNPLPGKLANAPQGMSLRAWMAGQALAGLLANEHVWEEIPATKIAAYAISQADALIAELEKEPAPPESPYKDRPGPR